MELNELKELIEFISKLDVGELEIENGDLRIYMAKNRVVDITERENYPLAEKRTELPNESKKEIKVESEAEEKEDLVKGFKITSPIVGTFYEAPAPGSEPFVKVGDIVKKGETLCIIEAMKIMNEIEAEFDCRILDRVVKNGESVEFGQILFIVEPLE
jgi:acetyl-CoA carboxylase biotin carboxyl carrier protein